MVQMVSRMPEFALLVLVRVVVCAERLSRGPPACLDLHVRSFVAEFHTVEYDECGHDANGARLRHRIAWTRPLEKGFSNSGRRHWAQRVNDRDTWNVIAAIARGRNFQGNQGLLCLWNARPVQQKTKVRPARSNRQRIDCPSQRNVRRTPYWFSSFETVENTCTHDSNHGEKQNATPSSLSFAQRLQSVGQVGDR